jgi:DNA repair exonuclease SbcCD nuclease subunit
MTPSAVRIAHFSDTHLERRQYPVASPTTGRNQREQDSLRAFVQVCEDINAYDPPLVIHSGDVADKPLVTYRAQLQVQAAFDSLTRRPDGTRRFVVVISGNHDMPRDPREPCYLEPALRPLSSVAVVTNRYERIVLADYVARGEAPAELENIVVHALPHDQLKRSEWGDIEPVPGKINILTSHGVVGGSELYKQCHGREYSIPIDVLTRGWDYVALGHWHKRGPIAVGGFSEKTTPIWYAGSPEHCGFSDLQSGQSGRGYLQVDVAAGEVPVVREIDLPIRAMFKMPLLDAEGMSYEEITTELIARVKATTMTGAVVDQSVIHLHRDTWSLVDTTAVRRAGSDALWFQLTPRFESGTSAGSETASEASERLGDIGGVLGEVAQELFPSKEERDAVVKMARTLLGSALTDGPGPDPDAPPGDPDADADAAAAATSAAA